MDQLKGNVFFNVTLSFWTNGSQSDSHLKKSSLPPKAAISYRDAISENSPLGKNVSPTMISDVSPRGAFFKKDLVKLVLINESKANFSIVDESSANASDNVNIINRHLNGTHLFDNLKLHRAANESAQGSIEDSFANLSSNLLISHYQNASLAHQEGLPSVTSISDATNHLLSPSNSLTPWNLTLQSAPTANWTDLVHLNNPLSVSSCLDGLFDGCVRAATVPTNVTSELDLLGQPQREYWTLFLIILPVLALFGNILVILSVYRERSLQTVTNWFIVSLAFADLFVTIPMLFSLYVMVNVNWDLSDIICDLYIAIDVICSTASIFNLVAISFDRYIAVTHPIFYSKHKNDKRVIVTIIIVWMASSGVGLPIILGANSSPERIPQLCIFYNSDFIIYSSLWSFYVPCLIMVILYYKIFKAIHDRARKKMDSTKSKFNSHNSSVEKNNVAGKGGTDGRNHLPNHENVLPNKQIQLKSSNAIKLEQIKGPIDGHNHNQTSVALISEINIAHVENNNINNTENHLEDEEEEDEEDLEECEEIEIQQLNSRCSSQFNSDVTCHCSIYANAADKLNNANFGATASIPSTGHPLQPTCRHRSCQKARQEAVGDMEPEDRDHLFSKTTMFIVENASTSLKLQHFSKGANGTELNLQLQKRSSGDARDGVCSPSGSSLATGPESRHRSAKDNSNNDENGETNKVFCNSVNHVTTIAAGEENASTEHNESGSVVKYSKKKSRFNLGRKHKSSRKKREKASAKRERKATKTLAIVLAVFLLSWSPFFSCNILDAICIKLLEKHFIQSDCRPGMTAFLLTTWLGYMNSCANPIIYTIFNRDYRKAFRKMLFK